MLISIEHRDKFGEFMNSVGLVGEGAEIGVAHGGFARALLSSWTGQRLWGIDSYSKWAREDYRDGCQTEDGEALFEYATNNLAEFGSRHCFMRLLSVQAAPKFADDSLDFAYLDANHSYSHVKQDMEIWWPKVKSGGILCGHDTYCRDDHLQLCEVPKALTEFYQEKNVSVLITPCWSWWIQKPSHEV